MKKAIPYIIGFLVLLLFFGFLSGTKKNKFDHRVTLDRKDKIPYGTFVAFESLPQLFPHAKLLINKKAPGFWENHPSDQDRGRQIMVIICREFNASNAELTELFHYVSNGNDVFISAYDLSNAAFKFFHVDITYSDPGFPGMDNFTAFDTLTATLSQPPFSAAPHQFTYPGRKFNSWFNSLDTSMTYMLGTTGDDKASFIRLRAGEGSFFIHTAPLAFSNYFLLYQDNIKYYNQVFSLMDKDATSIVWDEYYLHNPGINKQSAPSPLRVLLEQPAFRAALLTAIIALAIYVLLGMKRNQRYQPEIKPPVNDSLEFVKTIGQLYFQKGDNKNLCQKMSAHFGEFVYRRFQMQCGVMDENFVNRLSQKSGCPPKTIQAITEYIGFIQQAPQIHDRQVIEFYDLLNQFYKTV